MNNIVKHPAWWKNSTQIPPEPPDMELSERIAKIEAVIPMLATKADLIGEAGSLRTEMHKGFVGVQKEINAQTWRIIGATLTFGSLISAAVFFIARNVH